MAGLCGILLALGTSVTGTLGHGHAGEAVVCCDVCGVESAEIAALICQLQTNPEWRCRERAANALRGYQWKCHPEIAEALVTALLNDCHEEVREESAESLKKLAVCLPEVHAALLHARKCDPDLATRWQAKWALFKLDHCVKPCPYCEPGVLTVSNTVVTAPAHLYQGPPLGPSLGPGAPLYGGYNAPVSPPVAEPYLAPPTDSSPSDLETLPPPATEVLPELPPPALPPFGARDRDGDRGGLLGLLRFGRR